MIYFSLLVVVHSESYCHWVFLLLRFSYMFFCTEPMFLLNTLPIFWSLGFILVLHFWLKYKYMAFFPINLPNAIESFPRGRETNPDLCSNFRSRFIIILFFPLIIFYWNPFAYFSSCHLLHFHLLTIHICQATEPQKHVKLRKPVTKVTYVMNLFTWNVQNRQIYIESRLMVT